MKRPTGRLAVLAGLALVAVVLLAGGVSADRLSDEPEQTAPTTTSTPDDPYPLAAGTTPDEIQLVVFERAYSECASSELALLASKYKAADKSADGVAAVVGRAWASYFKAGRDAVRDGRDGCLQGQRDRSNQPAS